MGAWPPPPRSTRGPLRGTRSPSNIPGLLGGLPRIDGPASSDIPRRAATGRPPCFAARDQDDVAFPRAALRAACGFVAFESSMNRTDPTLGDHGRAVGQ